MNIQEYFKKICEEIPQISGLKKCLCLEDSLRETLFEPMAYFVEDNFYVSLAYYGTASGSLGVNYSFYYPNTNSDACSAVSFEESTSYRETAFEIVCLFNKFVKSSRR